MSARVSLSLHGGEQHTKVQGNSGSNALLNGVGSLSLGSPHLVLRDLGHLNCTLRRPVSFRTGTGLPVEVVVSFRTSWSKHFGFVGVAML